MNHMTSIIQLPCRLLLKIKKFHLILAIKILFCNIYAINVHLIPERHTNGLSSVMCLRARGGSGDASGDRGEADSGDISNGCWPFIGARALGTSSELSSERADTFSSSESEPVTVELVSEFLPKFQLI